MKIDRTTYRSSHFRKTRKASVDTIIIHYISALNVPGFKDDPFNIDAVADLLTKPIPIGNGKSVRASAHYLISRDGKIFNLVNDENVAWHAGKSSMPESGKEIGGSVNDFSIGIELVGGDWVGFTDIQYDALEFLCRHLNIKHKIPMKNILGHCQVSPGRKIDPGKYFDYDFKWPVYYADPKPEEFVARYREPEFQEPEKTNDITDGVDEISEIEEPPKQKSLLQSIISFILGLVGDKNTK